MVSLAVPMNHPARRSLSSDGEDDFLDLNTLDILDDDSSWYLLALLRCSLVLYTLIKE